MEAAQEVMFDKSLDRDARLKYSAYLLEVAQQQQNDSRVKSGRLVDDSRLCNSTAKKPMAAAPANPDDDPAGSSSHNKGGDKDPKDKQPHAESRTGSSRHREAGNNYDGHRSREQKEDPRKEKAAPPHQERL